MCTTSEEELGVMAYLLTQYNLKPDLRKFGTQGEKAPLKEPYHGHVDANGSRQAVEVTDNPKEVFSWMVVLPAPCLW